MKKQATVKPVVNSATVLAHLDAAITALQALQAVNEQLKPKLQGKETNPLGSRNLIVQLRQNLEFARGQIRQGILTDIMGNRVGKFADISDILNRKEDLSAVIDG